MPFIMDVDKPYDPIKRPVTPVKTSWFEFLLDASLLEEHLQKPLPDPCATDLIALFLYQADVAVATAKEIKDVSVMDEVAPEISENKKVRGLKLLALKVAAFLKWDLDALNSSIPLAMVQDILLELLKICLNESNADPAKHSNLNLTALPEHALFAIQLYHRWCLIVIMEDSFPNKPSKTTQVQVPGLEIPILNAANGKETVMNIVREGQAASLSVLQSCLSMATDVVMPTLTSLGHMTHDELGVEHRWDNGQVIPSAEMVAQISYDLGSMHFHMQDYKQAYYLFSQAEEMVGKLSSPMYCMVKTDKLQGFMVACQAMCSSLPTHQRSLFDRAEEARKNKLSDLVVTLLEDNQKRELNLQYRQTLEEHVYNMTGSSPLHQEVFVCNTVRNSLEGATSSVQFERMLATQPNLLMLLLKCIQQTSTGLSYNQCSHLKTFVRYLCYKLPSNLAFCAAVLESTTRNLFTPDEIKELEILATESETPVSLRKTDGSGDQSETERQLLTTYEPSLIKDLVQKLLNKISKQHIMLLTDKWRIPRELAHPIESLPIPWVQVYSYVLIAKSRICLKLKLYSKAKSLLQAADNTIKDISYKLAKLLRWELLKVDLLSHEHGIELSSGSARQDMVKKAKSCVTSTEGKTDLQPSTEVLSSAVAFLFNVKERDFLQNLGNINNGYVQFSRLLCNVCTTFPTPNSAGSYPQIANSRKSARELWEAVTQIFTASTQQKRTGSGATSNMQRESNLGMLPSHAFINFTKKIKDPMALSALLSCLMKFYTMLKSEINTEICVEFSSLWPASLPNVSAVQVPGVTTAVTTVIEHTHHVDPMQSSWLRTHADFCFANGEHSEALKHYMELAVLTTDAFADHAMRNVLDEQTVKKLIKCCSVLQCHTQVAVLCQFLDDVDYSTAFKALQEPSTQDAMDTYYQYIWNTTMLEYLINLHHRKGEQAKKQLAIQSIGQLEVNSSNPPEILFEAAKKRKANFLRTMAKQYL